MQSVRLKFKKKYYYLNYISNTLIKRMMQIKRCSLKYNIDLKCDSKKK